MFSKIIKIIFGDKKSRIKNKIDKMYEEALQFQRNGNIRRYSEIMSEIAKLEDEHTSL